MNWDWDKLQEKRQRQGKTPPPQEEGPENPFKGFQPGGFLSRLAGRGIPFGPIIIIALVLWMASGIFIVRPGEIGVIMQFGKVSREVGDGPHYHLPYPIEQVEIVNAVALRTITIGQTLEAGRSLKAGDIKSSSDESSMFTGDENIVHMRFNVQYNVSDPREFLFEVRDPERTVRSAAEAAMREVVGRNQIDAILTTGRSAIQVEAMEVLTNILKPYKLGISIHTVQLLDVQPPPEVEAAFKDVASAREDRVRIINEAEAYRMSIVPVANGTALGKINAAEAYARQVEQIAGGEAHRFLAMVEEFNKAKEITIKRMYLEAMGDVLSAPDMQKVILSRDVKGSVLPLLNLESLPAARSGAQSVETPQPERSR